MEFTFFRTRSVDTQTYDEFECIIVAEFFFAD